MIYDCFSFFNELDLLEIRLNTLNDVVDKFVLVEAPWTHTGISKPLHFEEHKGRFAAFLNKIIHIVSELPEVLTGSEREKSWIRENIQRNAIRNGLKECSPDDILIISDLDEIPDPNVIRQITPALQGVVNLDLRQYAFFLNNHNIVTPDWTGGPQILTARTFFDAQTYVGFVFSECAPAIANELPSATIIRFLPNKSRIKNAGWHFTSVGGIEAIQKKLKSFAHTEFSFLIDNPKLIQKLILKGKNIFDGADRFCATPIDTKNLPPYVVANKNQFQYLLLPFDAKLWNRRNRLAKWYHLQKSLQDGFILFLINHIPKSIHPMCAKIRALWTQKL